MDKELLLKDLCGRLPYGVKVQCGDYLFTFDKTHMGIGLLYEDFNRNPLESPRIILSCCYYGEDIKPYLFPMSSMTEEQKKEFKEISKCEDENRNYGGFDSEGVYVIEIGKYEYEYDIDTTFEQFYFNDEIIDWLNRNHFDYRGLIEKGLAINATDKNIY